MPGGEYRLRQPVEKRTVLPKPPEQKATRQENPVTRLEVRRIRLDGVQERPQWGIDLAELDALVERLRDTRAKQNQLQDGVKSERIKDPNLLKDIEKIIESTEDEANRALLNQVIEQVRSREPQKETLTLQQLQEIAAAVAQYYRDRGFLLVQAIIPPQTIEQGLVKIQVIEGILGHVTVEKNQRYTESQILEPFEGIIGQPVVQASLDEALLLLNDYPGLSTFAVFRPGLYAGETDLLVSVIEEDRAELNVHFDNYGSEFTGEFRSRLDLAINNPFQANDRLITSLSKTYQPTNGVFGAVKYERQAFGPRNLFALGYSHNAYEVGGAVEPFGISGTTEQLDIAWQRLFHRSRLFNTYGLVQFSRKSAKLDVTEGDDRTDELTVLSVEAGINRVSPSREHISSGRLTATQGFSGLLGSMSATTDPDDTEASRRSGSGIYAGSNFFKLAGEYQHWMALNATHSLYFSLRGQYSDDLLTSLEQMAIGGPNSVRAFPTAEYLRDTAITTSLEWLIKAPGFADWHAYGNKRWGELLTAAVFVDYATGTLNDPLASDTESATLSGYGAGLRFNHGRFSARLDIATALGEEEPSNERDPQYYFEMNYGF